MSNAGDIQPDPGAIGSIVKPPFAQLPDPARVFATRAERESGIGRGSVNPYLLGY